MKEVLAKGLGKNVEEAVIKCWYFEEGDQLTKGDDLVELATGDDTTVVITVPVAGALAEVYFDEGETVQRDEVICLIDEEEKKKIRDRDSDDEDEDEESEDDATDGEEEDF